MKRKDFDIVFSGLSLGEHLFTYELDDSFFELFGYTDYDGLAGTANVSLDKHNTFLELKFSFQGSIQVYCDRSNIPFSQSLNPTFELLVKFGDEYNDEDDEQLILPQGEFHVNIAQFIYELIVLNIPKKNIHPDVESGKIVPDFDMDDESELKEENEEIDPRWDKLKDLLN